MQMKARLATLIAASFFIWGWFLIHSTIRLSGVSRNMIGPNPWILMFGYPLLCIACSVYIFTKKGFSWALPNIAGAAFYSTVVFFG